MLEAIRTFIDFMLHLDTHLDAMIQAMGAWFYALMFLVIFCETGLIVTPLLPGDSLLFALGAFAGKGMLDLTLLLVLLPVAAIVGDTVNYWIGAWLGPKIFRGGKVRFLNRKHLDRTHEFFERYGGKTIVLARFVPIVRTFAPFVAGMGRMTYFRFMMYNVSGALIWVFLFVLAGYFFGSHPLIRKNFTMVILVIIILSIMPAVFEIVREWSKRKKAS